MSATNRFYTLNAIPPRLVSIGFIIITLSLFTFTYMARVSYAGGDARFSLLTAQAIIEHGTIQLDQYGLEVNGSQLREHNGRLYYYFPLGTPLFSVPFVWLANQFGFNMLKGIDDAALQHLLSAVTCVLIYGLLFAIGRKFLNPAWSLIVTTTTLFGSSLISTLGTALWNLNYSTLFILLAIWLWLNLSDQSGWQDWRLYLLGFALFGAFICRPTTAPFIGLLLGYMLLWQRRHLWPTAITAALFLGGWLLFNQAQYGQLLAPYYLPNRLQTSTATGDPTLIAIYGQLFSPSRGIFIFSPFFLLILGGIIGRFNPRRNNRLTFFSLIWLVSHIIIVSLGDSVPWWGGHSYGSRFLTDVIPALFLLSVIFFQEIETGRLSPRISLSFITIYLLLGTFAVFANSVQGLYNGNTARWNGTLLVPDPGLNRDYLFDWRYPQFLAFKGNLCERHEEFVWQNTAQRPQPYTIGTAISYQAPSTQATFIGWSKPQNGWRWSECPNHTLLFGPLSQTQANNAQLTITISSQTPQSFPIILNGTRIGDITIPAPSTQPQPYQISIPNNLLSTNTSNRLEFHLSSIDNLLGDPHIQGLRFSSFSITE